jgi:hypothetical protein
MYPARWGSAWRKPTSGARLAEKADSLCISRKLWNVHSGMLVQCAALWRLTAGAGTGAHCQVCAVELEIEIRIGLSLDCIIALNLTFAKQNLDLIFSKKA